MLRPAPLALLLAVLTALAAVGRRLTRRPPSVADTEPLPAGSTSVTTEDGVRLHVEVDAADSDLTVVLVHGFTARLGEFDLQRDLLRRHRVRTVLYDHRGHGRSAWGPPPSTSWGATSPSSWRRSCRQARSCCSATRWAA